MKLKLRKFDAKNHEREGIMNTLIAIIGKRNSGKTTLLVTLLSEISHLVDIVVIVSPTDEINDKMSNYVPRCFIHREPTEELIVNMMTVQRAQWKRGKGSHLAIVLDDCAHERKFFESKAFRNLAFNGRHMKITVFITMQFAIALPPAIRANTDVVFTMSERIIANRKRLYDAFFGMLEFTEFCQVMDVSTQNYESLVLWNKATTSDLSDSLFWYATTSEQRMRASDGTLSLCAPRFFSLYEHYSIDEDADAAGKSFTEATSRLYSIKKVDAEERTVITRQVKKPTIPHDGLSDVPHNTNNST